MSDYIRNVKLKGNQTNDSLSLSMQDEVIKIASNRLGRPLSDYLVAKVCQKKWSYIGLEIIIDSVKTLDTREIENYLSKLA